MATDLLKTYSNERVDLLDFDYLVDQQFQEGQRQLAGQFLVDPAKRQMWVIDGFETTNPAAEQIQVTRGRAFLAQREGGLIYRTIMTAEGDASRIIDASTLADGTYGVYIRFEYVEGDSGSRIFWNPAGTGSEFAQTVETRRQANWSMRAEQTSPGAEWEKVAEFAVTTGAITSGPTDTRAFYFEGEADDSFRSGWSTEGAGDANDRNADRANYGCFDLQSFTAAMRQCVEDVKGRGLRRWWDKGIGGMNVGFDDDPAEDRVAVGDADFSLEWVDPYAYLKFDDTDGDYLRYDRTNNLFQFAIGGSFEARIGVSGMNIANGLIVGNVTGTPNDNEIYAEGDIQSGTGRFKVDADDYFDIGAGGPQDWVIAGATEMRLDTNGLRVTNGLYVGNYTGTPTDNDIYAEGTIEAASNISTGGRYLYFGGLTSDDYIRHDDTANDFDFHLDNAEEYTFSKTQFDMHSNNLVNCGSLGAGAITGSSLNLGTGNITCGGIANNNEGMTSVGSMSGVTSLSMSGALSGASSVSTSGAVSGGSYAFPSAVSVIYEVSTATAEIWNGGITSGGDWSINNTQNAINWIPVPRECTITQIDMYAQNGTGSTTNAYIRSKIYGQGPGAGSNLTLDFGKVITATGSTTHTWSGSPFPHTINQFEAVFHYANTTSYWGVRGIKVYCTIPAPQYLVGAV